VAGYTSTPLARKLGIREGHRVRTWNAPGGLPALLSPLPDDVDFASLDGAGDGSVDVVLAFAAVSADLPEALRLGHEALAWTGGLWLCWPKKRSPLHVDLAEGEVRATGLEAGLVDNKICAVDEDWSGLRFVYRVEDRPKTGGGVDAGG
jgi:hypothetical protein